MAEAALLQVIQELKNTQVQMQQQMAMQEQALKDTAERMNQQTELIRQSTISHTEALKKDIEHRNRHSAIDTKAVGKPDKYNSKEAEWPSWSYGFGTWFNAQFEKGEEILKWAESHNNNPIDDVDLDGAEPRYPQIKSVNAQLHVILVSLMQRNTAAFEIVKNTGQNNGLDAWRRLSRKFDPNNPQANLALLKRVLHPKQASLESLQAAIEQWEYDHRTYTEKTKETLSDSMQRMCLQTMCPQDLLQHLEMETARLDT